MNQGPPCQPPPLSRKGCHACHHRRQGRRTRSLMNLDTSGNAPPMRLPHPRQRSSHARGPPCLSPPPLREGRRACHHHRWGRRTVVPANTSRHACHHCRQGRRMRSLTSLDTSVMLWWRSLACRQGAVEKVGCGVVEEPRREQRSSNLARRTRLRGERYFVTCLTPWSR
jgi:hypothetical protein